MSGLTTVLPDLRETEEGQIILSRMANLIAALNDIADREAPEVMERWCRQISMGGCVPCQWYKLQRLYNNIVAHGFHGHVIVGRRPGPPHIRLIDGTRRTAILAHLNQPIPYIWEQPGTVRGFVRWQPPSDRMKGQ